MQGPGGLPAVELAQRALAGRDAARRCAGLFLELSGAGPRTTASTVSDPAPGVRLRTYPDPEDPTAAGLPVLLVPAPIKRSYLWDLEPAVSVVARCRAAGHPVFLAEWTDPGAHDQDRGLEEYAHTLLEACLREVTARTGAPRVVVAGHSLGGTLAAVLAARRPDLVAGLVLLEAPMHFGADAGALAPWIATAPHAGWLGSRHLGVAGSFLDAASTAASPREFVTERRLDLALALGDPARLATHLRVERWMLDELAMPSALFEDVVERLYRRDELMTGTLRVAGRSVGPASLSVPLLSVVDPRSAIVPPRSTLPFHEAAANRHKLVLHYRGDVGVALQHVGVLVGRSAHRELWPRILEWMRGLSRAS